MGGSGCVCVYACLCIGRRVCVGGSGCVYVHLLHPFSLVQK